MAFSKFDPFSFFSRQTLLPAPTSHPQYLPFSIAKTPSNLHLATQLPQTRTKEKAAQDRRQTQQFHAYLNFNSLCIAFSYNYNVQVTVKEDEPEDELVSRFRREVSKAGVLRESKRRMFFETSQEKMKRKTREAAIRRRKRTRPHPQRKESKQVKEEPKKKTMKDSEDDDNWELFDLDLPYC